MLRQLWVIVGGNGSGKTSFYNQYLAKRHMPFVNADLIAKNINPDNPEIISYEASEIAYEMRMDFIREGISFCFETVFSHKSKIDFLTEAKINGYAIILIYIHLESADLNEARVFQRTLEGGHHVPADKIRKRIPRTLENVKIALPIVDEAWILDNSSEKDRFKQIIRMKYGAYKAKINPLPGWAKIFMPGL